jgi:hypothetical protein
MQWAAWGMGPEAQLANQIIASSTPAKGAFLDSTEGIENLLGGALILTEQFEGDFKGHNLAARVLSTHIVARQLAGLLVQHFQVSLDHPQHLLEPLLELTEFNGAEGFLGHVCGGLWRLSGGRSIGRPAFGSKMWLGLIHP